MSIRVLLADDHPVVRDGLRSIIEKKSEDIEVIGEASNGNEVLKIAKKKPVDIFILDISMPILNGIETANRLIKMDSKNKIIFLSIHDSKIFVEKAFKSGARGYILKESATEEVIYAIHEVYKDKFFLSPGISKFIINGFLSNEYYQNSNMLINNLTKREREILQLLAESITNKEIAKILNLSLNTVESHRKNIMRKLGIHKYADLVRYAIKEGISKL